MFKVAPLPRKLEAAQRDLLSADERVRLDVVVDLGRTGATGDEQAQRKDLLCQALHDRAPKVRRQAAVALADLGSASAIPELLQALADPEVDVRQMVVLALGELATQEDDEVLGRLVGLLTAGAAPIRFQALSAYASVVGSLARREIIAALSDPDEEVRRLAVRLIDEVVLSVDAEDVEGREALARAGADPSQKVSAVAQILAADWGVAAAREQIVQVVLGLVRGGEPRDEQLAIELCGRLELRDAEPALRRRAFGLFGLSWDPFAWPALASLARLGDPKAIRRIERGLASSSALRRNLAVKAVGDAGLVEQRSKLEALPPGACDADLLAHTLSLLDQH